MIAEPLTLGDREIELVTDDDCDCKAVIVSERDERGILEAETEAVIVFVISVLADRDKSAEGVSEDRGDDDREL